MAEKTDINAIASALLKKNKDVVLNGIEDCETYKISSGSLNLDFALGGGFGPGFHRFGGTSEAGKTSEAFLVMDNFFEKFPTGRGIYVKTERLTPELQKRVGLTFVKDPQKWTDGSCFILETNIYEAAADFIQAVVMSDTERKYFIIIDSMDGLQLKNDAEKSFEESQKVSGPAVVTKLLMKRISIYLEKYGHIVLPISQKTADIQISQYAPSDPKLMAGTSGGNALVHFSNNILEFKHTYNGDDILANPKERPHIVDNPRLGHYVTIKICKAAKEGSSHQTIKYPIKHGRQKNAIWIEKEVIDFLDSFGHIEGSGAWINFSKEMQEYLKSVGAEAFGASKFQGNAKFLSHLEENPSDTKLLVEYARKLLEAA